MVQEFGDRRMGFADVPLTLGCFQAESLQAGFFAKVTDRWNTGFQFRLPWRYSGPEHEAFRDQVDAA